MLRPVSTYHQLRVAVLKGSSRVSVGVLLAVHHTALHGLLNLWENQHQLTLVKDGCWELDGERV